MTVAFSAYLPEVIPHVLGCPNVVAEAAIRDAAIEFCAQTNYWQETRAAKTLGAATLPYTMEAPTGAEVSQVLSAKISGRILGPVSVDELDNLAVNWESATGEPVVYFHPQEGKLSLYPLPAGATTYNVVLRVAYTPTITATGADDSIYNSYRADIAAGALAKLQRMTGSVWANEKAALVNERRFDSAVAEVVSAVNRGFTRKVLSVRPRRIC